MVCAFAGIAAFSTDAACAPSEVTIMSIPARRWRSMMFSNESDLAIDPKARLGLSGCYSSKYSEFEFPKRQGAFVD
jgi:hypothetical protein